MDVKLERTGEGLIPIAADVTVNRFFLKLSRFFFIILQSFVETGGTVVHRKNCYLQNHYGKSRRLLLTV